MVSSGGIPFTKLAAALRKGRFLLNGKTREWEAMRGNSILRIAVHMERDMAALFVDTPGEPPSTSGRLMTFGEVMDLVSASVETIDARIKAEAERKAAHKEEVPSPEALGMSRKALERGAKAARKLLRRPVQDPATDVEGLS